MADEADEADERLIARIVDGDRDAFAILYRRYRPDVYRFAVHFCGSSEPAEDIVQDVFVAVIHSAARYRPERSGVLPWLLGIARNLARRVHARTVTFPLPADDATSGCELAIDTDPLAGIARARQTRAVRLALGELPNRYREAIILCDLHGLTYLEAATALGCAVGTVRSRLHRGRALLARALSDSSHVMTARIPATRVVL